MNKEEFLKCLNSNSDIVLCTEAELELIKIKNKNEGSDEEICKIILKNSRSKNLEKYTHTPNYILLEKEGKIKIGHATSTQKIKDIKQDNKLIISDKDRSLGAGVYVVNMEDTDSLKYLKKYLEESDKYEEMIGFVYGTFNGYYVKCAYCQNCNIEKGIYMFADTGKQNLKYKIMKKSKLIKIIENQIKAISGQKLSIIEKIKQYKYKKMF